jgi:muramoyltetrapeptide carboxypeptidase
MKQDIEFAIWSTSSPAKKGDVLRGLRHLKKLGIGARYQISDLLVTIAPQDPRVPFFASTEKSKITSLKQTLKAFPDCRNILAVRGGYGSIRLLKYLEPDLLKRLKKTRIWGFSDLTTIQNALFFLNGTPWVHSPMLTSDALQKPSPSERKIWDLLINPNPNSSYQLRIKTYPLTLKNSKALLGNYYLMIGGNLACFAALCGNPSYFKIPKSQFFLFLEDVSEKPHRIDRLLCQIQASGLLRNCKALVLGQFTDCGRWKPVFEKFCSDNKLPLFFDLKAGHARPNFPILMGQKVRIVKKSTSLYFLDIPFSLTE